MPTISMTPEEMEEYGAMYVDIQTFTSEMAAKFVTGASDIDAEWDNYINTLFSSEFKLDRVMEIYQGALDRYYQK